jgi:DnaJ-class molecular chaperone
MTEVSCSVGYESGEGTDDDILGLTSSCASEEIRGAYLNLCRRFHPDKTGHNGRDTTDEFVKVQARYKNVMERHAKKRKRRAGRAAVVISEHEDDNSDASYKRPKTPPLARLDLFRRAEYVDEARGKTVDIHVVVNVSLENVYAGCTKDVEYNRLDGCDGCDTNGVVVSGDTHEDDGSLRICMVCNGSRFVDRAEKVSVRIPPNTSTGSRIVMAHRSHDCGSDLERGDLVVSIYETPHPSFIRRERDLCTFNRVSYTQMAKKISIILDHPDGQTRLRVRKAAGPGQPPAVFCLRIPGMGLRPDDFGKPGCPANGCICIIFCLQEIFPHREWKRDSWTFFCEEFTEQPKKNKSMNSLFSVIQDTGEQLKFLVL